MKFSKRLGDTVFFLLAGLFFLPVAVFAEESSIFVHSETKSKEETHILNGEVVSNDSRTEVDATTVVNGKKHEVHKVLVGNDLGPDDISPEDVHISASSSELSSSTEQIPFENQNAYKVIREWGQGLQHSGLVETHAALRATGTATTTRVHIINFFQKIFSYVSSFLS